jgi:trimethylamine---corrinoid protein Co-methyltransferase
MVASLLGFSLEQLVIDNDIIGATQRTVRGIDVSEDALRSRRSARRALAAPTIFSEAQQTLARMQKEYLYPVLGDRSSPKEWEEKGRPSPARPREPKGRRHPRHTLPRPCAAPHR